MAQNVVKLSYSMIKMTIMRLKYPEMKQIIKKVDNLAVSFFGTFALHIFHVKDVVS